MLVLPEMNPGVAGIEFTVTASVCNDEEPQPLFAFTVIFPLAALDVVLILVLVEAPDHPDGNVHV